MDIAFVAVLFVLIAGLGVGIQSPLIGMLSSRLGPLEAVFVVHVGGAILSGIPLLFLLGGKLGAWQSVPWYAFLAGGFGVLIVSSIGFAIPRVGVANATVALIVAQLLVAAIIDHFGWLGANVRQFDLVRMAGFVLLLTGAWLVIRPAA